MKVFLPLFFLFVQCMSKKINDIKTNQKINEFSECFDDKCKTILEECELSHKCEPIFKEALYCEILEITDKY